MTTQAESLRAAALATLSQAHAIASLHVYNSDRSRGTHCRVCDALEVLAATPPAEALDAPWSDPVTGDEIAHGNS